MTFNAEIHCITTQLRLCGETIEEKELVDKILSTFPPTYRAPLLEECPQYHGHKENPGVTLGTCDAIGERAQLILV